VATRPRLCASCSWAALRNAAASAASVSDATRPPTVEAHADLPPTLENLRTLCDMAAMLGEDESTVLRRVMRGLNSSATAYRAELNRLTDKFLSSIDR
jgi:ABC-type transporter Mla subunit MlaD